MPPGSSGCAGPWRRCGWSPRSPPTSRPSCGRRARRRRSRWGQARAPACWRPAWRCARATSPSGTCATRRSSRRTCWRTHAGRYGLPRRSTPGHGSAHSTSHGGDAVNRTRLVLRHLALLLTLTIVYLVAGKLGLRLAFVHASATGVWAPTGIALAAFLTLGYEVWPAILCGAFLVNLTTAGTVATSIGISIGNTLEGVVGAYLMTRFA